MSKTVAKDICEFVQSQANAPEYTVAVTEAASQTFKAGGTTVNIVAGYLTDTGSDTPGTIFGVPAQDGSNSALGGTTAAPLCTVNLANTTNVFAANVLESGLADHVLTQSDIGVTMAIQRDTSNNRLFLNASTKAGANCRVFTLALAQNTDVGDTNGRVTFVFLPNFSQSLGTS